MTTKKPNPSLATKSQANAASAVMAATPMAEAAVVVAVAVVVTAPNAVSVKKAATNATLKAWKPVANVPHAVNVLSVVKALATKVAAHAKTATAVAVVNHVTPKAKQRSTTTLLQKPKPKHAPKHVASASPAKNAMKTANNAAKVAKAVANAAHAASVTTTAVNAPLALTRTAHKKSYHSTTPQPWKAKHRKPTRTVASVVSAARATVTAVTDASVATAHRVKKVQQNTPIRPMLLSTTTLHKSKLLKKPASHVNHVNRVSLMVSVKIAPHVIQRETKHHKLNLQRKPLHARACHAFKRSPCPWPTCKPWPKAVA